MVDSDMVTRLRPSFGVLFALVLALVLVPAGRSATGRVNSLAADEVSTVTESRIVEPMIAARLPRTLAPLPTAFVAAIAVAAICLACTSCVAADRLRRRLDDVGDDWRSLLLGAPPARV